MSVSGIEEVNKMLTEVPKVVVARGFVKALEASINVFATELEFKTPVQLKEEGGELIVEGGDLKGSIKTQVRLDSALRGGTAGVGYGSRTYIANWVEYGHRAVGHKPDKKLLKIGRVKAHPFIRPTFDAKANAAVEAFGDTLVNVLRGVL